MRLDHAYTGGAYYLPDYRSGPHRLFVAVLCQVLGIEDLSYALLDTASEWCVLPPRLAADLGLDLASGEDELSCHTRFGVLSGRLERIPLSFIADIGVPLGLEASCFVSEDWPGPMVIGWKGCLEWIRFALDPSEDAFYFAEL